jgi:hypothetical protein
LTHQDRQSLTVNVIGIAPRVRSFQSEPIALDMAPIQMVGQARREIRFPSRRETLNPHLGGRARTHITCHNFY